jgi:hypothetical protein
MYKALASKPRTLAEGIQIALDEMFKALETSIAGLSDAQVWAHPVENRNNVGFILLHVLENIDRHACYFQTGEWALDHEQHKPILAGGGQSADRADWTGAPGVQKLSAHVHILKSAVLRTLEGVTDRELYSPRFGEQTYWWKQHGRLSIDAYHRVVWHANAHIRQIWCLRGAMGAVDREHFPQQFWH